MNLPTSINRSPLSQLVFVALALGTACKTVADEPTDRLVRKLGIVQNKVEKKINIWVSFDKAPSAKVPADLKPLCEELGFSAQVTSFTSADFVRAFKEAEGNNKNNLPDVVSSASYGRLVDRKEGIISPVRGPVS